MAAERYFAQAYEHGRETERADAEELLGRVRADKQAIAEVWLKAAREADAQVEASGHGYGRALRYYRAAFELLGSEHEAYTSVVHRDAELSEMLRASERDLAESRSVLTSPASGRCETDDAIKHAERIVDLAQELREGDPRFSAPVDVLLEAADACFASGDFGRFLALSQAARKLGATSAPLPPDVETRWELARLRTSDERSESSAEQSRPEPRRRTVRVRERRPPKPSAASGAASPPAKPVSESDKALQAARELFEAHRVHEALRTLDAALSSADGETAASLSAQEEAWRQAREQLVKDYLGKAEAALRREQSDAAYTAYQMILEIQPTHPVALDRVRKLDALRKLRQAQH